MVFSGAWGDLLNHRGGPFEVFEDAVDCLYGSVMASLSLFVMRAGFFWIESLRLITSSSLAKDVWLFFRA